jgi:hypothetical protein
MLAADAARCGPVKNTVDTPRGSRLLKPRPDTVRQHTAKHMQMWTKFALIYGKMLKIPAADKSDVRFDCCSDI